MSQRLARPHQGPKMTFRRGRQQAELRSFARQVPDQETLDRLVGDADSALRRGMIRALEPWLNFTPKEAGQG